ncbi:ATP-binding sensor histidine kinase [Nostoc sp. FACHB-280]|uniref:ATP-binding sensor histidine kinase n=1 Tax=Nostoc sp. FACHB-280 TaxID=2692839 RepID=UPI00168A5FA8|nr:ATP-binding sensor histidine kinase [Nostoc sp. FACHB-280]MBD2495230.1 AAA family ATPase [Nostoc sp. FACHB-280]
MVTTLISIPGYQITEEIYNGARTLVYRGYREIDSLPVVMKVLKNSYPSFSELLSFRNQYTITKNLNSPLIVQTYSLETYQNSYILILEEFGGISLKQWQIRETQISLQQFLEIAIALCNTLDLLYQERIIHKDIKPSNILINPETKEIKLIDFSIASLLPRETQTLIKSNILEGTLAYISPEQTGRMNRVIDYRTDFYSLGVTFYELLTGELPFSASEPMEIVHCHIAKTAPLAHKINPQIPPILSAIVSKLMAKNAEDRYQSALGLKSDLENCLSQLQATGEIESFKIASRDVCDRFIIPDKLYGRETEVNTLLDAFERVSQGATEMMLVAGFSGIGKTAVVNEVHKPIVRQRGYFIKGKYDQFNRNIPLSAFVQAFRDLMGQLLTESDVQIQQWKHKILEAVGGNGQVIIEVIPELENIIGQQPPAIELSGTAAQNRFNLLFQKFTQVFTSDAHPLVIFLDDLQWADSASLMLIQLLMADTSYLFIIGAYRDNEVNLAHPLILTLNHIQKTTAQVNTINLAPLRQEQVNQLVADTLKCAENLALPLSKLVFQKTQGNPFFAIQFLKALYQDGFIEFIPRNNHDQGLSIGGWQCDITQINQQAITDDVVTFMVLQLKKLPQSTQKVLQLAACIGNRFDLATLSIVSQDSEIETATNLWKALQEGLILPISDVYKFYQGENKARFLQSDKKASKQIAKYQFLHDRIQQAAYSLIPEDQKQATHLKIGQLLQQNSSEIEQEEKLFDIVRHLNLGIKLINQPSFREELAQLNLKTGRRAKNSTAYNAAKIYLQTGIDLLQTNCWHNQYELTLKLYIAATEIAYLNGEFDTMENLAAQVLQAAQTILDKIQIYDLQIQYLTIQNRLANSLELGLQILDELDVQIASPELVKTGVNLPTLSQIEHQGEMINPYKIAAMQMLISVLPAVFLTTNRFGEFVLTLINLSLEFGRSELACYAYGAYAWLKCGQGEINDGYHAGKIALKLLEIYDSRQFKCKVNLLFAAHVQYWREHFKNTIPSLLEALKDGLDNGDIEYAGYATMHLCHHLLWVGEYLPDVNRQQEKYIQISGKQISQEFSRELGSIWKQFTDNLLNPGQDLVSLNGESFNEHQRLSQLIQENSHNPLVAVYVAKLILHYFYGEYSQALDKANAAYPHTLAIPGVFSVFIHNFFWSLSLLKCCENVDINTRNNYFQQVENNQQNLRLWSDNAPMNFLHKFYLVEAERYRVIGNRTEAMEMYDLAISLAKENKFIQDEALANELAGKFYLDWGRENIAILYMQAAYYCYARWGAKAKVADLERRYPQLLQLIIEQRPININPWETITSISLPVTSVSAQSDSTRTSISNALDFTSVLKAAQTISSNIKLDELITNLTQIILQNSGADKSVLILNQDDVLQIRAITSINAEINSLQTTISTHSLDEYQDIPVKIINYVKNTQQTIVIDHSQTDIPGLIGEYMLRYQPQSVLCTPILNQGNLVGILYLESRTAAGVFTQEHLQTIQILSAQAAIALENARLYQQMQQALEKALLNQISIDQTNVSVWWIEPDGQIFYVNDAACQGLGYSREELIGKYVSDISPVFPQELWAEHWQAVCEQGSFTAESYHKHKSGKIYPVEVNVNYVKFKDKEYNFVFTKDISERKQAEAKIQQKSQELATALHDLQQANLQIVQSEKMSALGNLVAGVAHEMNNPLGFIYATLQQTKPAFADIVAHLKLYQEVLSNPSDDIRDHAEEIDLDYTLEDLPQILDAMVMACDRLKNISTSLRTFSRADKDYKVPFNLHEGIDSTILILKHRLKANEQRPAIEVETNYGNLPQIECFPGQLNQVFMNILANAIDALDESNTGKSFAEIQAHPNRIQITTLMTDKFVKISIADNGKGMSEEVKQKIFDHLFTTKGVGKGTGLGLAIAQQIVEETHGGKLSCNSVLGEGTEFMIEIPA